MKYRIWFSNFSYFHQNEYKTEDSAVIGAKDMGFDAVIYRGETPISSYTILGGYKKYQGVI